MDNGTGTRRTLLRFTRFGPPSKGHSPAVSCRTSTPGGSLRTDGKQATPLSLRFLFSIVKSIICPPPPFVNGFLLFIVFLRFSKVCRRPGRGGGVRIGKPIRRISWSDIIFSSCQTGRACGSCRPSSWPRQNCAGRFAPPRSWSWAPGCARSHTGLPGCFDSAWGYPCP